MWAAILLLNGGLLGVVLTLFGKSAWKVLLLGILPHGILEIPAIMLGCAMGLLLCRSVMDSLRRKPDAQPLEKLFPALFRVFLCYCVPLLLAAAAIESWVTPLCLGLLGPFGGGAGVGV